MTLRRVLNFSVQLCVFLPAVFIVQSEAIKYNIWFKYPQPYSPATPFVYCKENVTSAENCTSHIPIFVNTLDSEKTFVPYSYNQFDFCPSIEGFEYTESDLTEWDDKIFRTATDVKFLQNEQCKLFCKKNYDLSKLFDIHKISVLKMLMAKEYYQHWFADNFPVVWCHDRDQCTVGSPVGYYVDGHGNPNDVKVKKRSDLKPDHFYIFNHIDFTFYYESGIGKSWGESYGEAAGKITAIRVRPRSIKHDKNSLKSCAEDAPQLDIPSGLNYSAQFAIYHTYSITFSKNDENAEQRWEYFLDALPDANKGKWYIVTAILIVLILAVPLVYVLSQTVFSQYELFSWIQSKPLTNSHIGWLALSNDIFKAPSYPLAFSALIGAGVQYIFCLALVEIFSLLVHFSTSTVLIVLMIILLLLFVGSIGGYTAARLYKSFGKENWKHNCLLTAALNPMMMTAALFLTRNFILIEQASAVAYPVGVIPAIFILLICYGIALPLTFAGAYYGYNYCGTIDYPIRPTANPREIPKQPLYAYFPVSLAIGGLIPFAAVWIIENYPNFNSGEFVITTCAIFICGEAAVVLCYLHLFTEDYQWWWRSYLTIGFAAVYYLIHCVCFIASTLVIDDFFTGILYGMFSVMLSVLLFSLIGTVGFLFCFAFVWAAYSINKPAADIDYASFPEA